MAAIAVDKFTVNEGAIYVLDVGGTIWRYNTKMTPHWELLTQLPQQQTNQGPAPLSGNLEFVADPPMTTPSDEAVQENIRS